MRHHAHRVPVGIYTSSRHLAVTAAVVALPFFLLALFSAYANIELWRLSYDVGISVLRLAIAYFLSSCVGWVLAVLFYRGKKAEWALPFFDVLQSFPTFAALPFAVLVFGNASLVVIFFLFMIIVWPIFFTITSSLRLIKRDWHEAVAIADLRGLTYIKKFLLPASAPGFITGSIIGLGNGWEGLVATEIIARAPRGLGEFFQSFSSNPTVTAFGILGLLALIFLINKIIWLPLLEWSHTRTDD
ncbi:MAG: ABC transporter permease subunit [Candidatus Sungbacteria bacterium]|uniref:ABC transporter permease subunit n=1 Tax=Candidatus Sungiibacteriota bacterium TaxID=2750080 RepID=A0A9D6LRL6_9BACT|nr:ABC transporter permease subunit [Candidatus Sungbacteria bacterium]